MFTSKSVWGVDIGESSIKAVHLKKEAEVIHVVNYDYIPLDQKLKAQEGALPVLQEAIGRLFSHTPRGELSDCEVCLSISSRDVNSRFITLPADLRPKDFQKAVLDEAEKQIPFPLDEVEWGYHRLLDKDDKAHVALFAVRRDSIDELLKALDGAKVKVRGVQVPGLALFNYITWLTDVQEHVIILDFGEKSTDLIVIHDGSFWLRNIPISGQHITELLEKRFRITNEEACKLKHEMESNPQMDKLFRVIEPKLKEMVVEIKRSINFRRTQVKDLKPARFLACGGSSRLPGGGQYFAQQLGLESFVLDPAARLDFSRCENAAGLQANLASFGVAMGLAIQGLGEAEAEVNLIPPEVVRNQIIREKRPFVVIANAILCLVVLMMFLAGGKVVAQLEQAKTELRRESDAVQKAINEFNGGVGALDPLCKEVEFLIDLSRGGDWVPAIYDIVCGILEQCPDVYLTEFSVGPLSAADYSGAKTEAAPARVARGRGGEDPAAGASSGPVLTMTCIGKDASAHTVFQRKLKGHPLFDPRQPQSIDKEYHWEFSTVLGIDDPAVKIQDEKVAGLIRQKRKEQGWDFKSAQEDSRVYKWNFQKLVVPLKMDWFLNPPPSPEDKAKEAAPAPSPKPELRRSAGGRP